MRDPVAAIEAQLRQAEALLSNEVLTTRASLSQWSVAEQLDHLLKVSVSILHRMVEGKTVEGRGINLTGRLILMARRIPRGRGRSPAALRGLPADAETLRLAIGRARELARQLNPESIRRSRALILVHPVFGGLTAAQSLRFLLIHTAHHLRIIEELRRGR